MNDKFSIITILSVVLSNQLFAAPLKYGHQLAPNQTLDLSNAQINIDSDPDTIDLYGVYYNNADTTTLNADATQINVTNNNTGTTLDNYQASAIYSNAGNSPTKASVNLGNASQLSATGDAVSTINLTNSGLTATNINVKADSQYNSRAIVLNDSEAVLKGTNNTINTSANITAIGIEISNDSSFVADRVNISASTTTSTTNFQNAVGVSVNSNSGQIVNLGDGSNINIQGFNGNGIVIRDGYVTAKNLTITGTQAQGVIVYSGTFVMDGGSVNSTGRGIVIGGISPTPPNYHNHFELTNVNIEASRDALAHTDGEMILNQVKAVSRNSNALSVGNNSVTTATNVILQGGYGNVVSASGNGQITFSGNTEIISTDPDHSRSNAIQSSVDSIVRTGANGSQMNIIGNLTTFGTGGTIDLEMNVGSHFTGQSVISDISNGTINLNMTDSVWDLTGDSTTTQLTLNNTRVNFTDPNYATLTTNQLAGNGFFTMHTDIASQQGDLIIVTGNSAGSHALNITNQGTATTTGRETLTVVETADGNADFRLVNQVEAGGYLYNLRKASNDTDWELYGLSGSQSSSALAGASFLNTSYLLNYVDNQTLLQRLGDLRVADASNDGFWLRSFGGKLSSFSGSNLAGFDMPYWGMKLYSTVI